MCEQTGWIFFFFFSLPSSYLIVLNSLPWLMSIRPVLFAVVGTYSVRKKKDDCRRKRPMTNEDFCFPPIILVKTFYVSSFSLIIPSTFHNPHSMPLLFFRFRMAVAGSGPHSALLAPYILLYKYKFQCHFLISISSFLASKVTEENLFWEIEFIYIVVNREQVSVCCIIL